jgi:hypothetical protein
MADILNVHLNPEKKLFFLMEATKNTRQEFPYPYLSKAAVMPHSTHQNPRLRRKHIVP